MRGDGEHLTVRDGAATKAPQEGEQQQRYAEHEQGTAGEREERGIEDAVAARTLEGGVEGVIDRLTERNSRAFPLIHEGEPADLGFEQRGVAEERDRERQPQHAAQRGVRARAAKVGRGARRTPVTRAGSDAAAADGIASWVLKRGIDLDTHFPLTAGVSRPFEGF